MNQFKELLSSFDINTIYLNLDALYDYLGKDLIDLIGLSKTDQPARMAQLQAKYRKNPLILSLFRSIMSYEHPYEITYDKEKYNKLSSTVLKLNNREILMKIFEYFLDEDAVFLNMDTIYDKSEIFFADLIDALRNDTFTVKNIKHPGFIAYDLKIKNFEIIVRIFGASDLMTYVVAWCNFMYAKTKKCVTRFNLTKEIYFNGEIGKACSIVYLIGSTDSSCFLGVNRHYF